MQIERLKMTHEREIGMKTSEKKQEDSEVGNGGDGVKNDRQTYKNNGMKRRIAIIDNRDFDGCKISKLGSGLSSPLVPIG